MNSTSDGMGTPATTREEKHVKAYGAVFFGTFWLVPIAGALLGAVVCRYLLGKVE